MKKGMSAQCYIFKKKLLLISFYRKKNISYDEVAYIVNSHSKVIESYCITILKDT